MEMEETVIDANQVAESSDATSMLSSPDFVPEGNANGEPAGEKAAEEQEVKTEEEKKPLGGQDDRFDKHPDWQKMRERAINAEAKLALLGKSPVGTQQPEAPEIPTNADGEPIFKDINKMSAAEVREWQEDDPIGFAKNLQEMTLHQISVQAQKNQQAQMHKMTFEQITKTFEDYASKNPDFNDLWDSGKIEEFMVAHPGHNAISAHMAMRSEAAQAETQKLIDDAVKSAVEKAVKETTEKVTKNFAAKRNATVISQGSTTRGENGTDPAIQDTNRFGGRNAVLANKLAEMRRQA